MGEAFWRFSLVLYSRPGVAEALLRLQEREGCNVNLILFALWCGAVLRHDLSAVELSTAEAATAPLQKATVLLRDMRRQLKPTGESALRELRRRSGMLELAAERAAQNRLAGAIIAAAGVADGLTAAAANLALYLGPERAACADAALLGEALATLVRR